MKGERIFEAIGAADPALLEQSEKRRKHHRPWWALGAAAAACLAAVLLYPKTPDIAADTCGAAPEEGAVPAQEETVSGGTGLQPLRLLGPEAGTLHFFAIRYGPEEAEAPEFLIYVDQERYRVTETGEVYRIQPVVPLPEDFPPVELEITHRQNCTAPEALAAVREELAGVYGEVGEPEETTLHAGDGTTWDAAQADVTAVEDGQGGCFLLTGRYFTEATEGHGVRFRDMVSTFQPVLPGVHGEPEWMTDLRETVRDLLPGLLAGDASVSALDFTVDNGQSPERAIVSVRYRADLEGGCDTLTLELAFRDGTWALTRSGTE